MVEILVKFRESNKHGKASTFEQGSGYFIDEREMFIKTSGKEIEEGSLVDLFLLLDKKTKIRVDGQVNWLASKRMPRKEIYGMGVEFFPDSWASYRKIKKAFLAFKGKRPFKEWWQGNYTFVICSTIIVVGLTLIILRNFFE